ncbi:hypothetical protein OU787_18605 [Kitasatospora sp. YST-16]|uniref:hypothetical protein n=1 Tax=Kitasatospora sp. YST-16 TaxID=2998080 RepID=UPI002283F31B|nr:hypothetical protein [Kitasatospora sp. YST-16]WAL73341.1 hypothetical protein OU787_18605 [Kitasatospora sp. YST-16]WNW39397.1 hypothetical protein RKE32_18565 [Streptomyces sp. Li-HN-5-13]
MPRPELVPKEPQRIVFQKDVNQAIGPERYELALALRELSQRLGVTLSRYAIRSFWDRSTVSRFLSGVLVPPADFVDQLIDDGDRATGTTLTPDARALVRKLHRTALRATSPEAADLQDLRDKLAAADKESRLLLQEANLLRNMVRHVHEQLDEQQARFRKLEQTGTADRILHRAELDRRSSAFEALREERDELNEMLARLAAELADAERRAREAEERCSALEQELEHAEHRAEERETEREEHKEREDLAGTATPEKRFANRMTSKSSDAGGTLNLGFDPELGARISRTLDEQQPLPLSEDGWRKLDNRPGLFQLVHIESAESLDRMYLGKASHSLLHRLQSAEQKIRGRKNTSPDRMFFTYAYVEDDLAAFAPEQLALGHLEEAYGLTLPWNFNGFGNKDAGRQRDTTVLSPSHFDMAYPIDLDWPIIHGTSQLTSPRDFLRRLKENLPYNFRYDRVLEGSEQTSLEVPPGHLTADAAFRFLAQSLGDSWQISALKGHVILYRERTTYPTAIRYYSGERVEDVRDGAGAAKAGE